MAEAQARVASQIQLPSGYWLGWGGQFENLAAARQRLIVVAPACFFLIFLLLCTALGSARDALLVFSAVPLALTGGIIALWLRGMPFSVSAAVGFIALSGVAVLNGLVMLSFIKQLITEGMAHRKAIFHGAMTRLRPVAMTSAGGFARIRSDGPGNRYGRGGAASSGYRGHWWADQRDLADASGAAGALCPLC